MIKVHASKCEIMKGNARFKVHFLSKLAQPSLLISSRTDYLHFTQTLTSLNLYGNQIGDKGAQHLASALQVNRVRLDFSPSHLVLTIFISHRH